MTAVMASQRAHVPALAAPLACGACLAAGATYVVANNPSEGGVFIPCPFRALTGLWCPGCGLTRATHHLFRGDVVQAFRYNAFVILILGAIVASWATWVFAAAGRTRAHRRVVPAWAQAAAVTVLLAFAVVRNVVDLPLRG